MNVRDTSLAPLFALILAVLMAALPMRYARANVSGFGSEACSSWTLRSDATIAPKSKYDLDESRLIWAQGFMSGLNWSRDDMRLSTRQIVIHNDQEASAFMSGVYHFCMSHPDSQVVDGVEAMWFPFSEVPYGPSEK